MPRSRTSRIGPEPCGRVGFRRGDDGYLALMPVGERGSESGVETAERGADEAIVILVEDASPVPDDDILPGEFDILS